MAVVLFWGGESTACDVLSSSYRTLRCRTQPAADVRTAVGQTIQLNVSIPNNIVRGRLFGEPDAPPVVTAPMALRFLDWDEAPVVSHVTPNAGSTAGGSAR